MTLGLSYTLVCLALTVVNGDGVTTVKRSDDSSMGLEAVVQQQAKVIQELEARVTALENKVPATFHPVAFTVKLSSDSMKDGVSLGSHSTVKFDTIVTNIANGYSTDTGIFTAPIAGVYSFFLTQMAPNGHGGLFLAIEKHGTVLDLVFAEGSTDNFDQGSSQVTTHLAAGEQVWVRENAGDAVRGGWWTIFTGFLLQAD